MQSVLIASAVLSLGLADGRIESIADDWQPEGLQPLPVIGVTTSSALAAAGDQYAPQSVTDGNRRTKWVGSQTPSAKSPQWITLELLDPGRRVAAVAVFGEAVDNDGVLDAQVQVGGPTPDTFQTVATVKDAKSPCWLATFDPVEAKTVRLLITRSAGPTSHTDVFEVVALGPPRSAAELKSDAQRRLAACEVLLRNGVALAEKLGSQQTAWPEAVERMLETLRDRSAEVQTRFAAWDKLTEAQRNALTVKIERVWKDGRNLTQRFERLAKTWPARAKQIQTARAAADGIGVSEKVAVRREDGRTLLVNGRVVLSLDERDGTWDATWLRSAHAALRKARFVVEVDGRQVPLKAAKTEVRPISDALGHGFEIRQRSGGDVKIERSLHLYAGRAAVVVSGRITNASDRDVSLGTTHLIDVAEPQGGWWYTGQILQSPAAVSIHGSAILSCQPASDGERFSAGEQAYGSTGVLMLANRRPTTGLAIGYLTALEARPDLSARFRMSEGGTALSAYQRFLGRRLGPGEHIALDPVYLAAHADPYAALERYGDAVAASAPQPVRTGATALWCSWYAHRMAMTEELVLANAAVAARHFKPLGFEIIQLDHGWQRGDVTGDWVPNKRFPHGLKWLAEELAARYGFKLGVWIAPTDVADVSATFREHADWMLNDAEGKPRVNWRWYWKPNPNCYELDASNPAAAKWIEAVFARLTGWGVKYYKIDFIAASGREDMYPQDPKYTRGWSVLRRAMEAVRRGAGPDAWIRYCQTPPVLSAGLASSAYGGGDTLDAGLGGNIEVLRANARSLAAGYWINDRLYHREVCDMSVRMQADIEEVRMRLAMMTLAGCSISFSDELQYLPPSRIRMMQQCLPPGNPPMRPLDLLDREIPSIWHIHCKNDADAWDVVGLFNFESAPQARTVDFAALGLPADADAAVFEFWEARFLGVHRNRITVTLPAQSSRILSVRRLRDHPQLIGTDMHLLQGYHEVKRLAWDEKTRTLSGAYQRMSGLSCRAFIYVPAGYRPHFDFPLSAGAARLTNVGDRVWMQEIDFGADSHSWSIRFDKSGK